MDVGHIKENKTVKLHLDYYYYCLKKKRGEREKESLGFGNCWWK